MNRRRLLCFEKSGSNWDYEWEYTNFESGVLV